MARKLLCILLALMAPFAGAMRAQWAETNLPTEGGYLASNDSTVYSVAFTVVSSSDNGKSWNNLTNLTSGYRWPIYANRTNLFAVAGDSGYIYHSTDYGVTWDSTCVGLPANSIRAGGYIGAIGGTATNLFAGGIGIYHSVDTGKAWLDAGKGIPRNAYVYAIALLGSYVFAGTQDSGIFRSSDSGKSWVACNNGLVSRKYFPGSYLILSLATLGTYLFAGTIGADLDTNYGIFRSTDSGKSWQHSGNGLTYFDSVWSFATEGTRIFAALDQGGVYSSSDSGKTWVGYNDWPPYSGSHLARSIAATYQSVFVGTYLNGIWQRPLANFGVSSVASNIKDNTPLSLFPNPTPGPVTIRGAAGAITVTNVLGEEVLSANPTDHPLSPSLKRRGDSSSEIVLDLSKLPVGTYFVRVQTAGGEVQMVKVVKQ